MPWLTCLVHQEATATVRLPALHAKEPLPASKEEQILAAKISRAMSSGASPITPACYGCGDGCCKAMS